MGFLISLSGLLVLTVSYITRVFINRHGGVSDVGLYNAGFTIITTYVGMVFTAMGTDYYPRLSAVANNSLKCTETINQQAEIALLILGPILICFLVFMKWIIVLLYSQRFSPIIPMISWAALGMYFRAASWSIGFVFLAKGEGQLMFWNELLTCFYMLLLNIAGYYYAGLVGVGIAFCLTYILHLLQLYAVGRIKYEFEFSSGFLVVFGVQVTIGISCFVVVSHCTQFWSYIFGCLLLIISGLFSIKQLDKRIGLKKIFLNLMNKK
jgi:O-antigen/teichoic acid export membrane protein